MGRIFARSVPANDFAIVRDTERNHIVASGNYSEMLGTAEAYNEHYQSVAYKAELWDSSRHKEK